MKVYILTVDKKRSFGNTKILVDDVYVGTYKGFEIAKEAIYTELNNVMGPADDFRRVSANEHRGTDNIVYIARYEDRNSSGNSNTYYIRELEFSVPEVKENNDLKKEIEDLRKEIKDLKNKVSNGNKPAYREEPIKEKEEKKSNVKFW